MTYICWKLTIWKTLISPKGVEKKAISREMELLRLTFTSFAISSCTAAASIFSPWVLRTLCQKKGRPLRSLRHTRRARVLLFVLVHFLWHVFKNVHFFISIFNAQAKEKKMLKWINLIIWNSYVDENGTKCLKVVIVPDLEDLCFTIWQRL